MIARAAKYTVGGFVLGCCYSETFARKVDRDLIRPFRNYHITLNDNANFRMPEDFANFRRDLGNGLKNFVFLGGDDEEE